MLASNINKNQHTHTNKQQQKNIPAATTTKTASQVSFMPFSLNGRADKKNTYSQINCENIDFLIKNPFAVGAIVRGLVTTATTTRSTCHIMLCVRACVCAVGRPRQHRRQPNAPTIANDGDIGSDERRLLCNLTSTFIKCNLKKHTHTHPSKRSYCSRCARARWSGGSAKKFNYVL